MQQEPQNEIIPVNPPEPEPEYLGGAKLIKEDSTFRVCRRNVALTYSRTTLEKDDICKFFSTWAKKPIVILATKEWHQDHIHHHIHAYIEWKDKIDIKNAHAFDIADEDDDTNYHPNVRRVYDKAGWIEYITKEDPNPLILGMNLAEFWKSKTSMRALICKDLITGETTIWDALIQYPQLLYDLGKIMQNLQIAQSLKEASNMPEYKPKKEGLDKKRHWWVYGESNTGKSTFLRNLQNGRPQWWFQIPINNDWVGYTGQPFLYLDEFNGQLTVQELNRICDGGAKVNIKMSGTQICKWPVVIIVSNYDISTTYKNVGDVALYALKNRFTEVRATKEDGSWMTPLVNFYSI